MSFVLIKSGPTFISPLCPFHAVTTREGWQTWWGRGALGASRQSIGIAKSFGITHASVKIPAADLQLDSSKLLNL